MQILKVTFINPMFAVAEEGPLQAHFHLEYNHRSWWGTFSLDLGPQDFPLLQTVLNWHQSRPGGAWRMAGLYRRDRLDAVETFGKLGWLDPAQPQLLASNLIRNLGRALYTALFGTKEHNEALELFLAHNSAKEHRLVFTFTPGLAGLDAPTLALMALPWETLWDPKAANPLFFEWPKLLIARSYQHRRKPTTHVALPSTPELCKIVAPFPQFDSSTDKEAHQRDALASWPRQSYDGQPIWCDIPPPQLERRLSNESFRQMLQEHQPHIVHLFCHGLPLEESFAFLFDRTQSEEALPIGPAYLEGETAPVWLLTCFVCFSGQVQIPQGPHRGEPAQSLITALTERIPATITMLTNMPRQAAVKASNLLYAELGRGRPLGEALRHMRYELYQFCGTDEHGRNEPHAWWVPIFYLSDPSVNYTFVDTVRRSTGHLAPLSTSPSIDRASYVEEVYRLIAPGQVVQIDGQPFCGKTTLLKQLLVALQKEGRPFVALDTSSRNGAERLAWLRSEITCALKLAVGDHAVWSGSGDPEHYEHVLSRAAPEGLPFVIALDNVESDDLRKLIPDPGRRAQIAFVVVTRDLGRLQGSGHMSDGIDRHYRLLRFTDDELQIIDGTRPEDYERRRKEFITTKEILLSNLFATVSDILFTIHVPLSLEDLLGICEASGSGRNRDQLFRILNELLPPFIVREEENYYRALSHLYYTEEFSARCHLAIESIRRWRDQQHRGEHPRQIEQITSYPPSLLAIIAHERHRKDIEPFRINSIDQKGALRSFFRSWNALAGRYCEELMANLFRGLVNFQLTKSHGPLDAIAFQYLDQRVHAAQQQYFRNNLYLWAGYVQEERFRLQRHLRWNSNEHTMTNIRLILTSTDYSRQIQEFLKQLPNEIDTQTFSLVRYLMVPWLKDSPDHIHILLNTIRPHLTLPQTLNLAQTTILTYASNTTHNLVHLLRSWLKEGFSAEPMLSLPLLVALLSVSDAEQQIELIEPFYDKLLDALNSMFNSQQVMLVEQLMITGVLTRLYPRLRKDLQPPSQHFNRQVAFVFRALANSEQVEDAWTENISNSPPLQSSSGLEALAAYFWACNVLHLHQPLPINFLNILMTREYQQSQKPSDPLIIAIIAVHDALEENSRRIMFKDNKKVLFKNTITRIHDKTSADDLFYAISVMTALLKMNKGEANWNPLLEWYEVFQKTHFDNVKTDYSHDSSEVITSHIDYLREKHEDIDPFILQVEVEDAEEVLVRSWCL